MNVGIIGYGSMGQMLLEKFAESGIIKFKELFISNRHIEKIHHLTTFYNVCRSNGELAQKADIIFICVRPSEIKSVLEEIKPNMKEDALVVSLNGSITFEHMEKLIDCKIAKAIPSVTAEVNQSQTLVCFNQSVADFDKKEVISILECMGNVIELPENEMGMGSELVSCMPGFIASIFDVLCQAAKKHTLIPEQQVVQMVLNTLCATGNLMLENNMTFDEVVSRVATKGGITEEGVKVISEGFPEIADTIFLKTLEKRRLTAQKAEELF
ncbi:MAG: NAD(P)-binding domain-containing protein [Lachnospiraceae bacterium]|nr:NAD(P)-binding domain-containing protein [Lachnospiraceae bacterium]